MCSRLCLNQVTQVNITHKDIVTCLICCTEKDAEQMLHSITWPKKKSCIIHFNRGKQANSSWRTFNKRTDWFSSKVSRLGLPWWSSDWDSMLPVQGAQVQSLIREADFHLLQLKILQATTKIKDPTCCKRSHMAHLEWPNKWIRSWKTRKWRGTVTFSWRLRASDNSG